MLPLHKLTTLITGKIALEDPEGQTADYVYQRCTPGMGNLRINESNNRQLRKFAPRTDVVSADQEPVRQRFQAAVAAWHALTPPEQADYHHRARLLPMTGYNLFHQEYAKAHPLLPKPQDPLRLRYLANCNVFTEQTTFLAHMIQREVAPFGRPLFGPGPP